MLDRLSKKILYYMQTSSENPSDAYYDFDEDLDEIAERIASDSESVRAAVRYLEENEYIKFGHTSSGYTTCFYLDHRGLHWKEFRKQEIIKYLEDKWIDFFALVVAFAALVISVLTWLQLP